MKPKAVDIERAQHGIHVMVREHVIASLKIGAPGLKEPAIEAIAQNLAIKLSYKLAEKVALGEMRAAAEVVNK